MAKGQLRVRILGDDSDLREKLEGSVSELGKWGAAAGAAGAAALGIGFAEGLDIEAANAKLSAGLGLTPAMAEKAGQVAGAVFSGGFAENIEEANAAVGAVMSSISGMADASAADLTTVTGYATTFADVFDVDVQRAAQLAGQSITQGLAPDATSAFDLMTSAAQQVPTALREDLLDAADEYGGFFTTLGFTGSEAFGVLVEGAEKGQFGIDKAGDAIKEFTIRSTDMSSASVAAFDAIGLDAEGMADKILAGGSTARGAFDDIVSGLLGIESPSERANAAIALFGTPIEDLNVSEIPAFLQSLTATGGGLGDVEGAAAAMADTMGDTAANKIGAMQNKIMLALGSLVTMDGALGTAATAVAGFGAVLEPVAPAATGLAVVFKDQLSGAVSAVGSGFGTAATAALKGAGSIATSIGGLIATGASWIATQVAQSATFVARWALMGVQSLLHAAKVAAAWLIAMGPIALVIAAVVGLVALIIANWDRIVAFTRDLWAKVTAFFRAGRERVVSFVRDLAVKAVARILDLRNRLVSAATGIRDRVIGAFRSLRDGAIRWAGNLVDWVRGLPGRILRGLGNVGRTLWSAGANLIRGFIDGIRNAAGRIISTIRNFVTDAIPGFVKRALGIRSPSRVMMALGEQTVQGLQIGLNSLQPTVPIPEVPQLASASLGALTSMGDVVARHQLDAAAVPRVDRTDLGMPGIVVVVEPNLSVQIDGREVARATVEPMRRELYGRGRRGDAVIPPSAVR